MPTPVELASTAGMLSFIFTGVRFLRATQFDPNPAIEAREAAEVERMVAEGLLCLVPPPPERRGDPLPFVGKDRRAEMIRDAEAWRRSA